MRWNDIYFRDFPDTDATELVFDAGSSSLPVPLRGDDVEKVRAAVNARPPAGPALACAPLAPISSVWSPGRDAEVTVAGEPAHVISAAEHFNRLLADDFAAEAVAAARKANTEPLNEAERDKRAGDFIENAVIDAMEPVRSGLAEDDRLRHLLDVLTDLVPWDEVGSYWRQRATLRAVGEAEDGGAEGAR